MTRTQDYLPRTVRSSIGGRGRMILDHHLAIGRTEEKLAAGIHASDGPWPVVISCIYPDYISRGVIHIAARSPKLRVLPGTTVMLSGSPCCRLRRFSPLTFSERPRKTVRPTLARRRVTPPYFSQKLRSCWPTSSASACVEFENAPASATRS